jgi:malate dehydrogenase
VAQGKALDLLCCGPMERFDSRVVGTSDYKDTAASDVVIVTAGIPRKPGMSRDDLIATNVKIVKSVAEEVAKHSPAAVMIVVSNPLDAMVYTRRATLTWRATARSSPWSWAAPSKTSRRSCSAGTATTWCPCRATPACTAFQCRNCFRKRRSQPAWSARAKVGGGEIVKLMGTSAYYAPASGSVLMAEAIIKDKKRIMPCAAYCEKEYGVAPGAKGAGYFVGVPCVLVKDLVKIVRDTFPELA